MVVSAHIGKMCLSTKAMEPKEDGYTHKLYSLSAFDLRRDSASPRYETMLIPSLLKSTSGRSHATRSARRGIPERGIEKLRKGRTGLVTFRESAGTKETIALAPRSRTCRYSHRMAELYHPHVDVCVVCASQELDFVALARPASGHRAGKFAARTEARRCCCPERTSSVCESAESATGVESGRLGRARRCIHKLKLLRMMGKTHQQSRRSVGRLPCYSQVDPHNPHRLT
ncbi:hypothetical protein B0H13DRAFT_1968728 [Mycena leptocephala]|nr:hypothetical protein B0H13DRAFT_1968728 [Mycena leptocephala]